MIVQPKTEIFEEMLTLESGRSLPSFTVAYETYGRLNGDGSNAGLICHQLSGSAHAAGRHSPDDPLPGWWDTAIGPGKIFDTDRYFIISSSVIGGCGGSTGPATTNPETGRPYAMTFPVVTIGDMVDVQKRLTDRLGIKKLSFVAGGCFGGFQALEWSVRYPETVEAAIVIAAAANCSAYNRAFFEVIRRSITTHPGWNNGDYYREEACEHLLSMAAMIGVLFRMTPAAMEEKVGRVALGGEGYSYGFGSEFRTDLFLDAVSGKSTVGFDPHSMLYVTKAMDYFDMTGGGIILEEAFRRTATRFLLLSYENDWRYPAAGMSEIEAALRSNGIGARHTVLDHPYGHSAFIFDPSNYSHIVKEFLEETQEAVRECYE